MPELLGNYLVYAMDHHLDFIIDTEKSRAMNL